MIGGGLLSGGSRGGQGNLLEMLTPNAVSNMTDSPIFSAGFGGRKQRKGFIRPDGSPKHFGQSMSSQQDSEMQMLENL